MKKYIIIVMLILSGLISNAQTNKIFGNSNWNVNTFNLTIINTADSVQRIAPWGIKIFKPTTLTDILTITKTGEQLRLGYDASNYLSTTTASTGATTLTATGSSPSLTLANNSNITGLLQITRTTEQLRNRYDASNYWSVTTGATGSTTFDLTGTSPIFTFSKQATFASDIVTTAPAYSSGGYQMVVRNTTSGRLESAGTEVVSIATATDADYTIPNQVGLAILPVITANRNVTMPTMTTGQILTIHNKNTSVNNWNIVGTAVKDAAGNTLTSLVNQQVYRFYYDGTNLFKMD